MSFEKIDLSELEVANRLNNEFEYNQISLTSDFPGVVDDLKTLDLSSMSIEQFGDDLERYYELLLLYLKNDVTFNNYLEEFKSLTTKISKYVLTSKDYSILRDGILELENYINQITNEQLYSEDGVYTSLQISARNFTTTLNNTITSINSAYSNLEQGSIGRVVPDGTISSNYLNEELKDNFNSIDNTSGIYVDRTSGEEIVLPEGLVKKPIVVKILNVSE